VSFIIPAFLSLLILPACLSVISRDITGLDTLYNISLPSIDQITHLLVLAGVETEGVQANCVLRATCVGHVGAVLHERRDGGFSVGFPPHPYSYALTDYATYW
jgi:hypothetical protein